MLENKVKDQLQTSGVLFQPVSGGGNNKIYKVTCADGRLAALKLYNIVNVNLDKLRLDREYQSLSFLREQKEEHIPFPIAKDEKDFYALYEWIEGEKVTTITQADLNLTVAFIKRLKKYSALLEAKALAPAADNALSVSGVIDQINGRLTRLDKSSNDNVLKNFLNKQYIPFLKKLLQSTEEKKYRLNSEDKLADKFSILSPSDFGFHNSLKCGEKIFFLDFEYFGWDDPAAMLAHFLWHPAMNLTEEQKNFFKESLYEIFAEDFCFQTRFNCLFPLIGLSWTLILLNEFIPNIWHKRINSGAAMLHERQEKCDLQLTKAKHLLQNVSLSFT